MAAVSLRQPLRAWAFVCGEARISTASLLFTWTRPRGKRAFRLEIELDREIVLAWPGASLRRLLARFRRCLETAAGAGGFRRGAAWR